MSPGANNNRESGARKAKYWGMYLYNFLATFRWHKAGDLAAHPMLWSTSEDRRYARIIPFEFDGRPAFIQPLIDYEPKVRGLLAGELGGQQTAIVVGEVGDNGIGSAALNKWLPVDLPDVLSLATGNVVQPYSAEFFTEEGGFVLGESLGINPPPFLRGRAAIDERIHGGTGELVSKYLSIPVEDRSYILSAAIHAVQGGLHRSRVVEDRLSSIFRGFEGLCRAHELDRQDLAASLSAANRDLVNAILRRAEQDIRRLKEEVNTGDDQQARILERIASRASSSASTDKAFGLQVMELLTLFGLHDAEVAEGYVENHPLDGRLTSWNGALSYRGVVVHEAFFDSFSGNHSFDDILDITLHLHDLLIRVILKSVGYSGTYQPMPVLAPAKMSIDWVEPGTEHSRLGYGLHLT